MIPGVAVMIPGVGYQNTIFHHPTDRDLPSDKSLFGYC